MSTAAADEPGRSVTLVNIAVPEWMFRNLVNLRPCAMCGCAPGSNHAGHHIECPLLDFSIKELESNG